MFCGLDIITKEKIFKEIISFLVLYGETDCGFERINHKNCIYILFLLNEEYKE